MSAPVLYGDIILTLGKGTALRAEPYTLSEGVHVLFQDSTSSQLQFRKETDLSHEDEEIFGHIVSEYLTFDEEEKEQARRVNVFFTPLHEPRCVTVQNLFNAAIRQSYPQEKIVEPKSSIDIHHDCHVKIQMDAYVAEFWTDFSQLSEHAPNTLVKSSEVRVEHFHTPIPSLSNHSVSFIKETPATARVVDKILETETDDDFTNGLVKGSNLTEISTATDGLSNTMNGLHPKTPEHDFSSSPKKSSTTAHSSDSSHRSKSTATPKNKVQRSIEELEDGHEDEHKDAHASANLSRAGRKRTAGVLSGPNKSDSETEDESPKKRMRALKPQSRQSKKGRNRQRKAGPDSDPETGLEMEAPMRTRSSQASAKAGSQSQRTSTKKLVVAFSKSSLLDDEEAMKFFQRRIKVADEVNESIDVLCVGGGEFSTTIQILQAITLGKPIVSDQWLLQSMNRKILLPHAEFTAQKIARAWKSRDWSSGNAFDITEETKTYTLCFTPALQKVYGKTTKTIESICKRIGLNTRLDIPKQASALRKGSRLVVLGREENDADVISLRSRDVDVYSKDLLAAVILRGRLDLGDEFLLASDTPKSKTPKPVTRSRKKRQDMDE